MTKLFLVDGSANVTDFTSKPVDRGGEPPDDGGMEARISALEKDLTAIKIDVAVIKANGATKSDVSEAKSAIIITVVLAIFLAQLLPMAKDFFKPTVPPAVTAPPTK